MKGKMKITVDKKITDEFFMEYCLNLYHSGYDPSILIGFYALGKKWHISKIDFLLKEMGV